MEKPVQEPPAEDQPMQKTLKGHPIPLPKRSEIMEAFKKITKGKKP
jgi:hypothetical protein